MADAAEKVITTEESPEQAPSEALQELLSDCTCPICQEMYTNPHQLNCGHTFCLRCFDKLKRKWHKSNNGGGGGGLDGIRHELFSQLFSLRMGRSGGGGGESGSSDPLLCPVCRGNIDPNVQPQPDPVAGALIMALKTVKAGRCKQADCWRQPDVCCINCSCGLCSAHHRMQLDELRASCVGLADEVDRYLQSKDDEATRLEKELLEAESQINGLHQTMLQTLQARMQQCSGQLTSARQDLEQRSQERATLGQALSAEAADLRQLLEQRGESAAVLAKQAQLDQKLHNARGSHPPSELQLGFEASKLMSDHEALLSRVSVRILKRPYADRADKLKPSVFKRTKRGEPWEVRMMDEGKLLVNYKGFPTRQLHVFSSSNLAETGTVDLQLTKAQFPGQTCVCNQRRRIFASDPKNHCVYEFNFQGQLTGQFGSKGSQPGQLHSPKGMYAYEDTLYVVDSKNKRVQLFNMDQSYSYVDSVSHDSLSNNIQAVIVGPACIVVCDRGSNSLVVFDRTTRQFVRQLPAGGEPFDICTDRFDNVIVSLTQERKVKVFDPSVAQCINTFDLIPLNSSGQPDSSASQSIRGMQNYLHGLAFDKSSGKLFVAEAFAKRLLGFDI